MKHCVRIIELYQHFELVNYLLGVFDAAQTYVYVSTEISEFVQPGSMESVLCDPADRSAAVVRLVQEAAETDVIVVCTRGLDSKIWQPLNRTKAKCVLLVHNGALEFVRPLRLSYDLLDRLRRLKWRWLGYWPRPPLSSESLWSGFVTSAASGRSYLRDLGETRPILNLPYAIWPVHPAHESDNTEPLKVAVPGSVDSEVREYHDLLSFVQDYRGPQVQLVVPGQLRSRDARRILTKLHAVENGCVEVKSRISMPGLSYFHELDTADVFWLPVRKFVKYATQLEIAGLTKGIGSLDDQVRHGKPALLPRYLVGDPHLSLWRYPYDSLGEVYTQFNLGFDTSELQAPTVYTLDAVQEAWGDFLAEVAGVGVGAKGDAQTRSR